MFLPRTLTKHGKRGVYVKHKIQVQLAVRGQTIAISIEKEKNGSRQITRRYCSGARFKTSK